MGHLPHLFDRWFVIVCGKPLWGYDTFRLVGFSTDRERLRRLKTDDCRTSGTFEVQNRMIVIPAFDPRSIKRGTNR